MGSVNKAILVGYIGQKPELRYTQAGKPVCNFSLATSSRYKQGDEWKEDTEWHRITAWGKQAESVAQHLDKGSQAYIEGRLNTRKWEDRDGNTRQTTEIIANSVVFVGGGGGRRNDNQSQQQDGDRPLGPEDAYEPGPDGEADVPF